MVRRVKLPAQLGWRFGLVILLLAVFSLLLGTQNAIDVNENTRCLATYAQRNAEVQAVRSAATAEKDAALAAVVDPLVAVILDVTKRPPQPADQKELNQLRRGARAYEREKTELAAKRAANPLPTFPERCSEVNK
jgi:hypothetical protein